jgi:proteasome lid subunit RPN8/RPN11
LQLKEIDLVECVTLKIKKAHLDEIFEVARKKYPIEACGILIGKLSEDEGIIEKVYHAKNVLSSTSAYKIDPIDELKAFEGAAKEGLDVIGFYHSHPFWEPFWSNTDEERGRFWVNYIYIVVSPKNNKVKVYKKKEVGVEEERLLII